jgi:hemolysin III
MEDSGGINVSDAVVPTVNNHHYKSTQVADIFASAIGWVLSVPGLIALICLAVRNGNGWHLIGGIVYGSSLVISYGAFTLYHVFKYHQRWGRIFKVLDHATIYLLISGTYTPFTLVNLRGNGGWTLFIVLWALTFLGVVFKIFFVYRFKILAPLIYLFMGWLILFDIKPALELIPRPGIYLLLAGGLIYTFGLIFYFWEKLRYHHAIWHLFVLAGSICHFFAIYYYVIP